VNLEWGTVFQSEEMLGTRKELDVVVELNQALA
jgi:hypothetical protein